MADRAAADYDINQHHHENRQKEENNGDPSLLTSSSKKLISLFDSPVMWFRERFVDPNRKQYPWYHRQHPRVPTIDQCYIDDEICIYEANSQFKRDRAVDSEIIGILRYRMDDCVREEYPDFEKCFPLKEAYEVAAANWFAKYGDLGAYYDVKKAFMKQKHRMIWERRHGPIGCGMKNNDNEISAEAEDH